MHAPWIGKSWKGEVKRLCLVGESHYVTDPKDDSEQLTCEVIQAVRDGTRRFPFHTRTAALLDGCLETSGAESIWDRVAFFNFIPLSVGTESTAIPTGEMWATGAQHFSRMLTELNPTHVLSLGQRQWNHIAFTTDWRSSPHDTDAALRIWQGRDGRQCLATWINHPSSRGFSVAHWRPRVAALLAASLPSSSMTSS